VDWFFWQGNPTTAVRLAGRALTDCLHEEIVIIFELEPGCATERLEIVLPMDQEQKRKTARDIIAMMAGAVVIVAGIVYLAGKSEGSAKNIETYCNINFIQGGKCRFTNSGTGAARKCTNVSLTNKSTYETDGTTVCSGYVGPYETKNVEYDLDASRICKQDWDNCNFNVQ